ncbi:MAG: hypothetical protein DLM58_11745 [Pseudonocardiales bacterium]|nr:MAG: hypothetical protein DLM58_11745 [Pseudonocardiales bacterium]
MNEPLIGRLAGATVSSVIFIGDYCQLEFNGPRLSAYVWPKIETHTTVGSFGDLGYRDLLCSVIGHDVEAAHDRPESGIVLDFAIGSIVINPEPSDLSGPEIAMLNGFVDDPSWDIWRPGEDTFAGRDWS